MMLRIFRDKLIELVRGEEGVAFVVTLGVFFFMYLLIAGVYAVGTSARERIHLQNACDAAAYSAAVVQADTLSRIATINRAMSWTYIQMTRRQMDYIVYKWLNEACGHHAEDATKAALYAFRHNNCTHGGKCPICTMPPIGWGIDDITLHGSVTTHGPYSESTLRKEYGTELPNWMKDYSGSFYSRPTTLAGLGNQIDDDLGAIDAMNSAETQLIGDLPGAVKKVAENVVYANLAHVDKSRYGKPKVYQCKNPLDTYFCELHNTESDEKTFIGFVDKDYRDYFKRGGSIGGEMVFDKGTDDWFVRGEGAPIGVWNAPKGIHRSYDHRLKPLYATWRWYATGWTCGIIQGIHWMVPTSYAESSECWHGLHDGIRCCCKNSEETESDKHNLDQGIWRNGVFKGLKSKVSIFRKWIHAVCYADNANSYDDRYKGKRENKTIYAHPQLLSKEYFGEDGTITVGIACKNENPWYSIMRQVATEKGVLPGIFGAFNHFCDKTLVFASAKAGYRMYDEAKEAAGRNYKIDWGQEEAWNLYTSDWDAVLMPVRMAKTMAESGKWGDADHGFLAQWVSDLGVSDKEMCSGGKDSPDLTIVDELDDDSNASQTRMKWRWYNASKNRDYNSGLVRARWQIEQQEVSPNWNSLTDRMFH